MYLAAQMFTIILSIGTANDPVLTDLLQFARESQHEKILRGIAVGIALLYYQRQEEADSVIETLLAVRLFMLFTSISFF